jgi:hypothetical protein
MQGNRQRAAPEMGRPVRRKLSRMAPVKLPRGRALAVASVALVAACTWAWARSNASVPLAPTAVLSVDTSQPGNEFGPGAVGLSMEARELSSGRLSASHLHLCERDSMARPDGDKRTHVYRAHTALLSNHVMSTCCAALATARRR